MEWVLAAYVIVGSLPWLAGPFLILAMRRAIPLFRDLDPPEPTAWPRLSIVIPACDEASTLEPALRTLLAQDYPDLEIVLVDDRSKDGTSEIVDRMAAGDPRVRPVHITELPAGWLGKVHALHRAMAHVTGRYVLFTDADVHFAAGVLTKAVAWCESGGIDHLVVIPELGTESLPTTMCVSSALRAICISQRPWRATDPEREEALGGGAFNLVRRAAFDRTPGFEWLRMEVADDIGLGLMMKRGGGKPSILGGFGAVKVDWYTSLAGAVRGMEKNGFAQLARFSLTRGVLMCTVMLLISTAPLLAFLPGAPVWLAGIGAIAFVANLASAVLLRSFAGMPLLPSFLSAPFGDLIMIFIVLRASVLGYLRGGVIWRGTVYPSAALREGMRVKF